MFYVYCCFGGFASRLLWSNIFLPPTVREREEGRGVTEFDGQIMEMLSITSSFLPHPFSVKCLFISLLHLLFMNREKNLLIGEWCRAAMSCSCCAVCGPWYCLSVRAWCQWHGHVTCVSRGRQFPRYRAQVVRHVLIRVQAENSNNQRKEKEVRIAC